jgi:hypothetical protein
MQLADSGLELRDPGIGRLEVAIPLGGSFDPALPAIGAGNGSEHLSTGGQTVLDQRGRYSLGRGLIGEGGGNLTAAGQLRILALVPMVILGRC